MITWNEKKRRQVIKDHRVDFKKIGDVFDDPFAIYSEDHGHGHSEERWLIIAKSAEFGLVAVTYTFRNGDTRLITARRAEKWMRRLYEQQKNRIG